MPRCQRTYQRLPSGDCPPGGVMRWVCPYCPDSEIYSVVQEPELLHYATLAENYCHQEFGKSSDAPRPYILLYGLHPECALEQNDRRYDIYLQHDSDGCQLRLQIGHEMFHRFCSQGRVFHWTHEMLACLTAVRLLRRLGNADYADEMARVYAAQAEKLSLSEMMNADLTLPPYPAGLYGRAFMTGLALQEIVSWNLLRRLSRSMDKRGEPDISGWLTRLPAEVIGPVVATLKGAEFSLSYHAG